MKRESIQEQEDRELMEAWNGVEKPLGKMTLAEKEESRAANLRRLGVDPGERPRTDVIFVSTVAEMYALIQAHRRPAPPPPPPRVVAPVPVPEPKPVAKPAVKKKHAVFPRKDLSAGVKRKSRPYCVSCGEEKPEAGTLHGWTHRGPGRSVWTCSEQCAEVYEDCQHQAQAISLKDVFG